MPQNVSVETLHMIANCVLWTTGKSDDMFSREYKTKPLSVQCLFLLNVRWPRNNKYAYKEFFHKTGVDKWLWLFGTHWNWYNLFMVLIRYGMRWHSTRIDCDFSPLNSQTHLKNKIVEIGIYQNTHYSMNWLNGAKVWLIWHSSVYRANASSAYETIETERRNFNVENWQTELHGRAVYVCAWFVCVCVWERARLVSVCMAWYGKNDWITICVKLALLHSWPKGNDTVRLNDCGCGEFKWV